MAGSVPIWGWDQQPCDLPEPLPAAGTSGFAQDPAQKRGKALGSALTANYPSTRSLIPKGETALPQRNKAVRLGESSPFLLCFAGGSSALTHKDVNNCILENVISWQLLRVLYLRGVSKETEGLRGSCPAPTQAAPGPALGAHAHSPVRQSGFHGAHGVEGGLHGEFPGGVALAALLMSEQQQAAELLAPGGQQGCKEEQDGQWSPRPPHSDMPAPISSCQTGYY